MTKEKEVNKCPKCDPLEWEDDSLVDNVDFLVYVEDNRLHFDCVQMGGNSGSVEINYCPACGRKLYPYIPE